MQVSNPQGQSMILSQEQRMQMVLAPQLRQSLEMLQLPVLELKTMIRQELEKNPTLEELADKQTPSQEREADLAAAEPRVETEQTKELDFKEDFQVLASLDDEWRNYFFQQDSAGRYSREQAEKRQFFLDSVPQTESLQEHLMRQLELAGLPEADRQIGELLVGSINDDGYLALSIEELAATAGIDPSRMNDVLAVVQDFSPVGVGSRDLRECLGLQLDRLGKADSLAAVIVKEHLKLLAGRKFHDIARLLDADPDEVRQAADLISALNPKPGHACSTDMPSYILPEILVQKVDGKYVVVVNDDNLPRLRISEHYKKLMQNPETSEEVKQYILQRVRSGVFLIKSIEQRQQTLFKIATEIVKAQVAFLDGGLAHMKPLTMAQVAATVGVHETTVSRAVSGKYMQTPGGTFEMRYFFAPGFTTSDGASISNKTVQDMLAQIVASEDPAHPLSDQEILSQLAERGVKVARRTIAKYRLVLRIPPSHMRKSF